jgi:hypothetical protein
MQAFEINLAEIKKDKTVFSKYCRLNEIIKSPYPYPMVTEADCLLTVVQDFHKRVERKKMEVLRSNALVNTEKMIRKLIGLFDTFIISGIKIIWFYRVQVH